MTSTAANTTYRLRCLGPAQVTGADDERVAFETRKHVLLLYHLGRIPGRPVSRDELTDLFWHGDEEKKARHSLSHAISLINKSLRMEAIAPATASRVVLKEGVLWLDAREFERLVADGQFMEAREIWQGTLFEGYWVPRAPRVEEWLASERSRLERVFRRVLHELIEEHRSAGDHEMMRRDAETLLELDELDEQAMLGYLEALTLVGDRTLALRRYAEFETRLSRELHAEPVAALKSWAKRQRRGDKAPLQVPRLAEHTSLPAARPLFGRDAEFGALWSLWERATIANGAFVIVEGEAGIGKSALAGKLANQVSVSGGAVCLVRCFRSEKPVPFAPITSLVSQLSRQPGFMAVNEMWISELSRIHLKLRERFPHVLPPLTADDTARHRLCDAVLEATRAVCDEQPLLILVDDLQDADEASLALVHYLARQAARMPMLMLCIARLDATASEPERTFVASSRAGGLAHFTALGPLSDREIARVANQVFAQRAYSATQEAMETILSVATGNPLRAIEAAFEATASRQSPLSSSTPVSEQRVATFEESSLDRLQRLSNNGRLVAKALALFGRPVNEHELALICALVAAELAAAIEELEREGFVREASGALTFAHDKYQKAAEDMSSGVEKRDLHVAIANQLSQGVSANPRLRFELAMHLVEAGEVGKGRRQAQLAVQYAASVGAIRSQAHALELTLRTHRRFEARIALDLAVCYLSLNDFEKVSGLCAEARRHHTFNADFKFCELAAAIHADALALTESVDQLEALVTGDRTFPLRADALLLLLRIAAQTYRTPIVRRTARELRRNYSPSYGHFATAYVRSKYFWAESALPCIEAALTAAQAERNWAVEQLSRDGVGVILLQTGRYHESIRHYDYSASLARKTMNLHAEKAALQNRAVSELALGDYEKMESTHQAVRQLGGGNWALLRHGAYNDALVSLLDGRYEQALEGFRACRAECQTVGFPLLEVQCLAGLAVVSQRLGDSGGLREHVRDMKRVHTPDATACTWIDWAATAYDSAINDGEFDRSIATLQHRCRELARRNVSYWLALELELLRLKAMHGKLAEQDRRRLIGLAERYGAKRLVCDVQAL